MVEIAPHHQAGDGAAHRNHPPEAFEKGLDPVLRDEIPGLRLEASLPFEQLVVGRLRSVAGGHALPTLGHEPPRHVEWSVSIPRATVAAVAESEP